MFSALITIWLLHGAALLTPGANVLLISRFSASGDSPGAVRAAIGVTAGAAIWSSAAVLGVNALFVAFPTVRLFLQIAGGGYLLYTAFRLWCAPGPPVDTSVARSPSAFRIGLLTNLSNPKSALFFGSVFSAALPAHPSALVLCTAVTLIVVNALCWHLLLAFVFSRKAIQAGYGRKRQLFTRIAASAVGALGLSLIIASFRQARV